MLKPADAGIVDQQMDRAEPSDDGWSEKAYWKKFANKSGRAPEKEKPKEKEKKKPTATAPKGALTGRIEIKRAGMGFLISDPPGNDIFIPPDATGGALTGDLVAVELRRKPFRPPNGRRGNDTSGHKPVGRVVKILERAHPTVIGTFYYLSRSKKASALVNIAITIVTIGSSRAYTHTSCAPFVTGMTST